MLNVVIMKLREFLNYRNHCLSCGKPLNLSFHSKKRQKYKFFNDKLLIQMDLNSIHKGQKDYKVGYSINCETNDFCIEFFDRTGLEHFENEAPLFLIDRFKKLDKNHGNYHIMKYCNICQKYWYRSNCFNLDYKTSNLGDLTIHSEHGAFVTPYDDGYRLYRLYSYYEDKESFFDAIKISNELWYDIRHKSVDSEFHLNYIKTHVIPFKESLSEIIERLNMLMTFS